MARRKNSHQDLGDVHRVTKWALRHDVLASRAQMGYEKSTRRGWLHLCTRNGSPFLCKPFFHIFSGDFLVIFLKPSGFLLQRWSKNGSIWRFSFTAEPQPANVPSTSDTLALTKTKYVEQNPRNLSEKPRMPGAKHTKTISPTEMVILAMANLEKSWEIHHQMGYRSTMA